MFYPFADPHPEGVWHSDEAKDEEDVDGLEEVAVKLEVERRREQDCSDKFALRCHETFWKRNWICLPILSFLQVPTYLVVGAWANFIYNLPSYKTLKKHTQGFIGLIYLIRSDLKLVFTTLNL